MSSELGKRTNRNRELFHKQSDEECKCTLCPRYCILKEKELGFCLVRKCEDNKISLDNYAGLTHIAVEPIEKKPLFHFLPGSKTLSIGSYGCNLRCKYCENYKHSQIYSKETVKKFFPEDIVSVAIEKHCQSVCMTYNEPILYYEYLLDVAEKCHENDLKFILKTNAYINKDPWSDICKVTDAMNIDWKGSDLQYHEVTGANDCVIRKRIREAYDVGVHIEVSIPLYYGFLDDIRIFYECGYFLCSLDKKIPCHLLKVFPANEYEKYRSTSDIIASTADMVLSFYMDNVYVSDN